MGVYEEISEKLDELYEKIQPYDLGWLEDAKKTFDLFTKFEKLRDFLSALESVERALENDKTKEQELKQVRFLLNELQKSEPDFLIEKLKRKGYSIAQNNKDLKDAIGNGMFRLLEQIRLGKRDAVMGMLIRSFATNKVEVPMELIEASKPKYDINLFRAFMYAFLSGFIDKQGGESDE